MRTVLILLAVLFTTVSANSYETCDKYCGLRGGTVSAKQQKQIHHVARRYKETRVISRIQVADGIIRSKKTGAQARVAARYQAKFQAYIDDVEAAGGKISFMGGIRPGRCSIPRSKHPCGMAVDLCQYSRGVVDHKCLLPPERVLAQLAARHGLLEGGVWCHGDRGHAEVRTARQAEGCGSNLYSAVHRFKKQHRVASRS